YLSGFRSSEAVKSLKVSEVLKQWSL
ncbi:hypothetical protein A2U01_0065727, partial [Trifolium medium]|nr:hypothetical protein [Trifolium medium]